MRTPRVHLRTLMVAVAVAAPAAMVAKWTWDRCVESGQTAEVLTAVVVCGAAGLVAMRHPLMSLPFAVVSLMITDYPCHGFNAVAAVEYGVGAGAGLGATVSLLTRFWKWLDLPPGPSSVPPLPD